MVQAGPDLTPHKEAADHPTKLWKIVSKFSLLFTLCITNLTLHFFSYFQAIVKLDQKYLNGEHSWPTIKDMTHLPLPTCGEVLAEMGETASSEDQGLFDEEDF